MVPCGSALLRSTPQCIIQVLVNDKQMLRISSEEYRRRLESLQADIAEAGLDLFIVSAFDSLYYLTGAAFEPLERPFFLLIRLRQAPILLVPKLEHEHMKRKTHNLVLHFTLVMNQAILGLALLAAKTESVERRFSKTSGGVH